MSKSCWLCVLLVLAINAPNARAAEDKIPVVNEDALNKTWIFPPEIKLKGLAYPPEYRDHQEEVCLAIGYVINPDGHASDLSLLKSWSSGEPKRDKDKYWAAFADATSAELSQWKFVPAPEAKSPGAVYTVSTFVFASPSVLESSKRCAIPSLTQHIRDLLRNNRTHRRMASNGVFNRLDLDPTLEARFYNANGAGTSTKEAPPPPGVK
ncbi:hypothetical protein [Thermomonas sp.]|uniref:hypothetical protein n=1 Tax=Thermomonas sp. TaxID=1971895 RepID=UPI002487A298|nr:hypothetical protein [Thermomonas sp.]MDI1251795.1 hypothetical protein [Thermomonas sp.]